jgi:hypothetical protein
MISFTAMAGTLSIGSTSASVVAGFQLIGCVSTSNPNVGGIIPVNGGAITAVSCAVGAKTYSYPIMSVGTSSCYGSNDLEALAAALSDSYCATDLKVYVAVQSTYTSVGCFQDSDSRAIATVTQTSDGSNPAFDANSCGGVALSNGNTVFGLQNKGTLCFTGNDAARVLTYPYLSSCGSTGQFYVSNVFVRTIQNPLSLTRPYNVYQNIGCYRDSAERTIPSYYGVTTPEGCMEIADSRGKTVFGMQFGGLCFIGSSVSSAISLGSAGSCPILGQAAANQVFVRKYCFPGTVPVSSFTGNPLTMDCRPCAMGSFCPGDNSEQLCPMDSSTNSAVGLSACIPCDTDGGYSTIGLVGQATCTPIPRGYYLTSENVLQFCGTETPATQHYIGGGYSPASCRCDKGWTGDHCEYPVCLPHLGEKDLSLCSLLFYSDQTLRAASQHFLSPSFSLATTLRYLKTLLEVEVDISGNGYLTRDEVVAYLTSRSIYSKGMERVLPLWCPYPPSSSCLDEEVSVSQVLSDAMTFFETSPKHSFDGSGISFVANMSSTYPSPFWSEQQCKEHNKAYDPLAYEHVATSWNFTGLGLGDTQILQVCGYVNGLLNAEFSSSAVLSGQRTSFVDLDDISSNVSYKRVYCISVLYQNQNEGDGAAYAFECSVGLFYVQHLFSSLPFHCVIERLCVIRMELQWICGRICARKASSSRTQTPPRPRPG